jgi:hypothetical protein
MAVRRDHSSLSSCLSMKSATSARLMRLLTLRGGASAAVYASVRGPLVRIAG